MAAVIQGQSFTQTFILVSSTDHTAPLLGASPSVVVSQNAGAFAPSSGVPFEIGDGWYGIVLSAVETGTLGPLSLHVTAAGADDTDIIDQIFAPPAAPVPGPPGPAGPAGPAGPPLPPPSIPAGLFNAISGQNLCRLDDLKSWLSISTAGSDQILASVITSASRAVVAYLSRPSILPRVYSDRYDGQDNQRIMLKNWPVLAVSSVSIRGTSIAAASPDSAYPSGWLLEMWDGAPPGGLQALDLFNLFFVRGSQNIAVTYLAGYGVEGEPAKIPAAAPFTINALAPFGAWALDLGLIDALTGLPLTAVGVNPAPGQYAVSDGLYQFNAANAGTPVSISYGFVPQDIIQATVELAAERYRYRDRIGVNSKSLGGQETVSFTTSAMPAPIAMMLQPYRAVIVPR